MAIRIHEGFKVPGRGLVAAAIMSLFTDRVVKDDDDAIRISELCDLTSATYEQVIEELRFLEEKRWLQIANGDWAEAGSIRIEGFQIVVGIDQMTLPTQPPKPDTSSPTQRREETNKDEVTLGGRIWFGTVEYNGEQGNPVFALSVSSAPKEDLGSAEIADEQEFTAREEAWRHFDNYTSRESRLDEQEQTFIEADGTVWNFEIEFAPMDPDRSEEVDAEVSILKIYCTPPDQATSTLKAEERFDTEVAVWEYVDQYLAEPEELSTDSTEIVNQPEAEGYNSERTPTQEQVTDGVTWRHWANQPDGNDHFELDLASGTVTVRRNSAELLCDSRSFEDIVKTILREHGVPDPAELRKGAKK